MLTYELPFNLDIIQILGFSVSLLITLLLTPLIRSRALKLGLMDLPSERRIHKVPTPRLGGIGIYLGFFLTTSILIFLSKENSYYSDYPYLGIFVGGTMIFVLGLLDDIEPVQSRYKLLVQIIAASVAWFLGVRILHIVNPLYHADFGFFEISIGTQIITFSYWISYLLTVLWIVGITNAINLVDGMDGLATGVSLISAIAIWAVSLGQKIDQPAGALLSAALAGSLLGFLRWNFNPARIFLGDSGSYLTGFVLSALTITCVMKSVTLAIMTPMLVLIFAIPIVDMLYAIIRRLLKGKPILEPDKEHLHHQMLATGLNQKAAVYVFYLISTLLGLLATYLMSIQSFYRFLILSAIVTSLILFFTFVINWKHQKIFKK